MKDMPTIQDVAREAGVSAATVSRALSVSQSVAQSVAPATRARVSEVARRLGYKSSQSVRSENNLVLALVPHMRGSFFTDFLDAASHVLAESGYCLVTGDLHASSQIERHFADALRDGRFAGVILVTGKLPIGTTGEVDLRNGPPAVLALNGIEGVTDYSVFGVADRAAARKVVSYLVDLGHRRIAHIRGPADNGEARDRYQGYVEALQAAGLQIDSELIWEGDFLPESGTAAAGRYLACPERPSAVFAGNDLMAMGFISQLKASGACVPTDVSVAGFDNIEFAEMFDPPLTTMRQPREEVGRLAALDLLRRISTRKIDIPVRNVLLECSLVIRKSTQVVRLSGDTEDAFA